MKKTFPSSTMFLLRSIVNRSAENTQVFDIHYTLSRALLSLAISLFLLPSFIGDPKLDRSGRLALLSHGSNVLHLISSRGGYFSGIYKDIPIHRYT